MARHLLLPAICTLMLACTDNDRPYVIGVSQCAGGQWRQQVNREMLAAQHLYERDVQVVISDAQDDPRQQVRQIDSLVAAGIDLLVVAPAEAAPVAEAVQRTHRQGIPVIYFDRKAATDDYTAFIGGNNQEAGRMVGDYVLSLCAALSTQGRKPRVLEITGAMSSTPAQERHQGFASAMAGRQDLDYHLAEADWTSDMACHLLHQQLRDRHQPDVVFCHNDGMATGVYKAVVEADIEGQLQILGIDGMPDEGLDYVQLGHQKGTYVYPTHGELVVRLAIDILTGRPYSRENTLQGLMVTPDNVDLVRMNARELTEQTNHLVTIQDKLEQYSGLLDSQRRLLTASLVVILLLIAAAAAMCVAYVQTRRTIRKRQALNEEQTLFYTHAAPQPLRPFLEQPEAEPPVMRSQDELFSEQLNTILRQQMGNPQLKMDDLGEQLGISRVQLYRRVKAITGLSPVELLRQMRLQKGYMLLCNTTKTVQEIAYEVGFSRASYFSKCFKDEYGRQPGDVRRKP